MPLLVVQQFLEKLLAFYPVKFHPRFISDRNACFKLKFYFAFVGTIDGTAVLISKVGKRCCEIIGTGIGSAFEISRRKLFGEGGRNGLRMAAANEKAQQHAACTIEKAFLSHRHEPVIYRFYLVAYLRRILKIIEQQF